jgi:hypothetical protein
MSKWFRFGSLASRLSRVGQDVDRATLQGATLGYDVTRGDTVFKTSIELAAHYAIPRTNVVAGVRFQQ